MAAEAAIELAVGSMGKWLVEKEAVFPKEVKEEVESVIAELRGMECFLKDAEQKQASNESIRKWISDIRDVAYDAEDAIEIFIIKVEKAGASTLFCFGGDLSIQWVGKEIESIRTRLKDIGKRFGIQNLGEVKDSSRGILENVERLRGLSPLHKVKYVVSLNEDVDNLLQRVILNKERKGLYLAAIVGMRGSGKSTLAKEIFNHPNIKFAGQFDCRAWVVVSSEFSHADIIKQILMKISSLDVLETTKKLEESTKDKSALLESLKNMLHQQLKGKQYFIVLDDMGEYQHWKSLRSAFPDEPGKKSRLLFTSRNQIIGEDDCYINNMRLLNEDESWQLLLKTAFIRETDGKCPQELESIGREIMQKCSGVPLAIIVAGGLLAYEGESKSGWKRVLQQIKNYRLETNNDIVYAILELSYQNLPPQLKACFLCLGFFKEDAVIRAKELVQIWIVQGLISCEEGGGMTEEIGRRYLNELVNRNLVQVKDMRVDHIKTCHVHDLLHELSRRKAKKEIGMEILGRGNSSTSSFKPRHSVVHHSSNRVFSMSDFSDKNKYRRSLFVYGPCLDNFFSGSYWKSFELLRILEFDDVGFHKFPGMIRGFIRLRYLRIGCNERTMLLALVELPRWLDRLKNLEVLVIDGYSEMKLPDDRTWKIDSLRHFKVESMMTGGYMKIGSWKNLETLKYIDANSLIFDDQMTSFRICKLGKRIPPNFSAIRKLGIRIPPDFSADRNRLHELLLKMHNLVQLHIKLDMVSPVAQLDVFIDLDQLTKLKLQGLMQMPILYLRNLCHLTLKETLYLCSDPMPVLGKLRKLLSLKFYNAYQGSEMRVLPNGFPSLKLLSLQWLYLLRLIKIEEGAMPQLQRFEIVHCELLNTANLPERLRSAVTTIVRC